MRSQRYQFTPSKAFPGLRGGLSFVDIYLTHKGQGLHVSGLVNSGSTINVLPYDYGLQLGLDWHSQDLPLQGVGYLEEIPSYAVLLQGQIDPFPPVLLVFMWTRRTSDEISLILGQVNFFEYFRVIFDKTDGFLNSPLNTNFSLSQCVSNTTLSSFHKEEKDVTIRRTWY